MNKQKFQKIFQDVLTYWPDYIKINQRIVNTHGNISIPELRYIDDKIETIMNKILMESDIENEEYRDWLGIINWEFSKILNNHAKTNDIIYPKKFSFEEVYNNCLKIPEYKEDWEH